MSVTKHAYLGIAIGIFCLATPYILEGQSAPTLRRDKSPIVKHEGGKGIPFPKRDKNNPYAEVAEVYSTKKVGATAPDSRPRVNKSGALPELKTCTASRARRIQVAHFSKGTTALDYLFYNGDDYLQVDMAKSYKNTAVAYHKDLKMNQEDPIPYSRQAIALTFGVECLPTRFHFITEDGKRYMEYREGELAWGE